MSFLLTSRQAEHICQHFGAGPLIEDPIVVLGGRENQVWVVQTSLRKFAIKRVPSQACYEETEKIAVQFCKAGIPTATAHQVSGKFIYKMGEHYFLLFDWIESVKYRPDQVIVEQAKSIGALLAHMHSVSVSSTLIDLSVLNDRFYHPFFDDVFLMKLLENAILQNVPHRELLKQQWPLLIEAANESMRNDRRLLAECRLSHRDMTPNNVIWAEEDHPVLVDWELSGLIHPLVELLGAAFDWSIVKPHEIAENRFLTLLKAYYRIQPKTVLDELTAAFSVLMGIWLSWLFFNLEQYLDASNEIMRKRYIKEVEHTLFTFSYIYPEREYWLSLFKTIGFLPG